MKQLSDAEYIELGKATQKLFASFDEIYEWSWKLPEFALNRFILMTSLLHLHICKMFIEKNGIPEIKYIWKKKSVKNSRIYKRGL